MALTITLLVTPGMDTTIITGAVQTALTDTETGLFGSWNMGIGQTVFDSQIEAAVLAVEGVVAMTVLTFAANGTNHDRADLQSRRGRLFHARSVRHQSRPWSPTPMADDGYVSWYQTKLWQLLPAVYRAQDATVAGVPGPLQELLNRIGAQSAILRRSIDRMWENQSIETCDDWVIPYIGDLLSTRLVSCLDARAQRLDVAKTIYYRRRAGTLGLLEELVADIAGRDARAVEFFRRLGRTRHQFDPPIGNVFVPDAAPWEPDTTYAPGEIVANGANAYVCVAGGISGSSGGPTGGGTNIADGGVTWSFDDPLGSLGAGGDRGAGRGEFAHPGRRLRRSAQCLRRGQYRRRVRRVRPYRRPARRRPVLRLVQYFASRHVHLVAAHLSDLGCDAGGGAAAVGPGVALLHVRPQRPADPAVRTQLAHRRELGSNV